VVPPLRSLRSLTGRCLLALVLAARATASGDQIIAWPGSQGPQPHGLFSRWQADQRKVLEAVRQGQFRRDRQFLAIARERLRADPTRLEERLALARALWRSGRVAEAVAQFRVALTLEPGSIVGRLGLAVLYRRCGRPDAALAELRELVASQPRNLRARLALADALARLRRTSEAIAALRDYATIAPDDPAAATALASLLLDAGQRGAARRELERALELDPSSAAPRLALARLHRLEGNFDAARQTLAELAKEGHPRAHLDLALLALAQRRPDEARGRLKQPPKEQRHEGLSLFASAVGALARGDHDEAIALATRLRERGAAHEAASLLLNIWLAKGDRAALQAVYATLADAREELAAAYDDLLARSSPRQRPDLAVRLALVSLYRLAGWRDQAIAEARQARRLLPASVFLGELLASCYQAAERLDDELAVRKELVAAHPDRPSLGVALARCHLRKGDYEAALAACERVVERHPRHLDARLFLARLASMRGDYALAARSARAAANDHPQSADAWRILVWALVGAGDLKGAAAAARRREIASPAFVPTAWAQAVVALSERKWQEALSHCEKGLAGPDPEPALHYLAGLACEGAGRAPEALRHLVNAQWMWLDQLAPHLAVGRVAERLGRFDVAADAWQAAVAKAPRRSDLWLRLAGALTRAGRPEEALAVLRRLEPPDPQTRLAVACERARALLASGRARDALDLAERILQEDPSRRMACQVALAAARRSGAADRALALLENIHKRLKDAPGGGDLALLLLVSGHPQAAASRVRRESRVAKPPPVQARLARIAAAAALAAGDVEWAVDLARRLQEARSPDAPGSALVALSLAAGGADDAWRAESERLARSAPWEARWLRGAVARLRRDKEASALAVAGLLAFSEGWHGPAAGLLARALARLPDLPFLLGAAARAEARAGRLTQAIAHARKLAKADPEEPRVWLLLGAVLEAAGKHQEACESYWRAVPRLRTQDVAPALAAARLFERLGRIPQAMDTYRKIIELDPGNALARNNLAWLYAEHRPDKLPEAETLAAAAVAAEPDVASFHDTLGWLRFLRKDYHGAREEILRALALRPTKSLYFYHLGMVEFSVGQRSRAERALRLALRLEPEMAEAATARATLKVIEAAKLPGSD